MDLMSYHKNDAPFLSAYLKNIEEGGVYHPSQLADFLTMLPEVLEETPRGFIKALAEMAYQNAAHTLGSLVAEDGTSPGLVLLSIADRHQRTLPYLCSPTNALTSLRLTTDSWLSSPGTMVWQTYHHPISIKVMQCVMCYSAVSLMARPERRVAPPPVSSFWNPDATYGYNLHAHFPHSFSADGGRIAGVCGGCAALLKCGECAALLGICPDHKVLLSWKTSGLCKPCLGTPLTSIAAPRLGDLKLSGRRLVAVKLRGLYAR